MLEETQAVPTTVKEKKLSPAEFKARLQSDVAAAIDVFSAAYYHKNDRLGQLLDSGTLPTAIDKGGNPLLSCAAKANNAAAVSMILARGVNVDQKGYGGRTALHHAALHGSKEAVSTLVNADAQVDVADESGLTPLMLACQCGDMKVVDILLGAGSDLDRACHEGFTPIMIAGINSQLSIVDVLLKRHVDLTKGDNLLQQTALHQACRLGNRNLVAKLLEAGASTVKTDINRHTPSDVACNAAIKRMLQN